MAHMTLVTPRWRKVLADLWNDKTRTALVVASIAVGVFAVGVTLTALTILSVEVNASYARSNPVNIDVTTGPISEGFTHVVGHVPGTEDVEVRRVTSVRVRRGSQNWQTVSLIGVPDFDTMRINQLALIDGTLRPGRGEVLFTRDQRRDTGFRVGDVISVDTGDGSVYELRVAGLVTDQQLARATPNSAANAFVTMDTLGELELGDHFNRVLITVDDGADDDRISAVADAVTDKIEHRGLLVLNTAESRSDQHPMNDTLVAILGTLTALGVLITVLSASLIVNTLNALLAQQMRQIGVMKLIGGLSAQIMGMYLGMILAYSVIALVIAVPSGLWVGYLLSRYIAGILGATIGGFQIVPVVVVAQLAIAFLVPLGAGLMPVVNGTRIDVRQALSDYRPSGKAKSIGFWSRLAWVFAWIPRPVLLSVRNTFRKKGRLILTVFTLTMAGAVFIAVINTRTAMGGVMNDMMSHSLGDIMVSFSRPYNVTLVEHDLGAVDGVVAIEAWGAASGEVLDAQDDVVTEFSIVMPPKESRFLDLDLVAGRRLMPDEQRAMVVSESIYDWYPALRPGDQLTVSVGDGDKERWTVVGVFSYLSLSGEPLVYANFDYVARETNSADQALSYRLAISDPSASGTDRVITAVDAVLEDEAYQVASITSGAAQRATAGTAIDTIIIILLIMALLTAVVGSIGLTGTMSINVLERTREIGVMRTIGAVDGAVMQIVVIEGLVIGLITWLLAIGLAVPITSGLLTIIGQAFIGEAFAFAFDPTGVWIWLAVVIVLSIIASVTPALSAARLTINEVLAYE